MKRLLICLSIAAISVTGVYAQDGPKTIQQQEQELKDYKQKLEKDLQTSIRTQKQQYTTEAAQRMQTRKQEVQNDLDARRSQLMYRPEGMTPYKGN